MHVHVTLPALLAGPGRVGSWRPSVYIDDDGRQVRVELRGRTLDSIVGELSRVDLVLEDSADRGIDRLVVSPWVSTLPRDMDSGAAADVCRAQNEALAVAVRNYRGRVAAFGAVPLDVPTLAAEMLGDVVAAGLAGVEITPNPGGRWLGDPELTPFWEAVDDLGAYVFVHPSTQGLGLEVFDEYYLWNAVANPFETTTAAAHMIMAGVLERHPDIHVILAHGGGVLPMLGGRLERAWLVRSEAKKRLSEGPVSSLRRFYFDTVTHGRGALASLISTVGAAHVLLGSDHPFDMGVDDPLGEVRALDLPVGQEDLVVRTNAGALFPPS